MTHNSAPLLMFEKAIPILPSLDINESVEFYTRAGFTEGFSDPDSEEPYAIVERDCVQVHFWKCDDPRLPSNSSCRIKVSSVDRFYETLGDARYNIR